MESRLSAYQKLPRPVQDFLLDVEKEKEAEGALTALGLSSDVAFDLLLLAEEIIFGTIKPAEFEEKIKAVALEKQQEALKELFSRRLLPLSEYYPDTIEAVRVLLRKEITVEASVEKVRKEKVAPEEFVVDLLSDHKLHLSDPVLEKRLEFLLGLYVRGTRNADQTSAALVRPIKVGGLDLPEEQTKKLIGLIDEGRSKVEIVLETARPVIARQAAERPRSAAPPPEPFLKTISAPLVVVESPTDDAAAAARAITSEVKKAGFSFVSSPDLFRRFSNIINGRFKGLRDTLETKAVLSTSVISGGLGLETAELEQVATMIEQQVEKRLEQKEKQAKEEKERWTVEQKKIEEDRIKAEQQKHEETLAKRFTALTGRAPSSIAAPKARLSPQSIQPEAVEGRPKVTDVKFVPQLSGPLEELSRMGPDEFRRLAKDPELSAVKVKDLLDLIAAESSERRLEGLRAWQNSPLHRLYVSLFERATRSGQSVNQIAQTAKESGQPWLSDEEIKAIIQLNASSRF